MSKNKNHVIWSLDHAMLENIADEQENYIGRDFKLDLANNQITIFALPRKYKKKQKEKAKHERSKRREKFERRG